MAAWLAGCLLKLGLGLWLRLGGGAVWLVLWLKLGLRLWLRLGLGLG